jgi:hypothetical protein
MNGFGLALPAIAAKTGPSGYVHLPSDISALLNESKPEGFARPGTNMTVSFTLPVKDAAGLSQFLGSVDNPSSPFYHRFLSSAQFAKLFGPDAGELKALEAYLESYGLSVAYGGAGQSGLAEPNLFTLKASGGVQQIEQALKTQIGQFNYKGTSFFSATAPASLPSQFGNVVKVGGLSSQPSLVSNLTRFEAVPLYRTLHQVINKPSQNPGNFMYYSPSEIESMYNITSLRAEGINGSGVTISIVDAYGDPYIQSETNQFDHQFGIPNSTINVICVDGPCNYAVNYGWNTEIALDVEWAHALAPNATINLYIGSNAGSALYDAVEAAVLGTNGNGTYYSPSSIISLSWGIPENDIGSSASVAPYGFGVNYPWLNQVFQQAAAEGMTVFAASGDWGAYDQGFGQTSPYGGPIYPSTDPFVTGVGGTSLYADSSSGYLQYPYMNATTGYGSETGWSWNNAYDWGTGGGCSTLFGSEEWQNTGTFCAGQRGVPDVAWNADVQTGVVVDVQGSFEIIGGTSVGAPSWAGSMALVDQNAGRNLGWIDPTLYAMNASDYAKSFHDVTVGNNDPLGAAPGWDPLTGLGSPNVGNLAKVLEAPEPFLVSVKLGVGPVATPLALDQTLITGSVLHVMANVTNLGVNVTEGVVTAHLFSSGDINEGTADLAYNSTTGLWNGTYTVPSSAPPGEWSVSVAAVNGTNQGTGYATFSVGDGITIAPWPWTCVGCVYLLGQGINVYAAVSASDGSAITSGNYWAAFNLGGPSGKLEGNVSLAYNGGDGDWEGHFTIPSSANQGSWTMTVGGADVNSTLASAYTWIYVGLPVEPYTDSPTYLQGDTMGIAAYTGSPGGAFSATVSNGGTTLGTAPLSFSGQPETFSEYIDGDWYGSFGLGSPSAVGFDNVNVSGGDGYNYGSFSTVVRVAAQSLNVAVELSKPNIAVNDTSCVYDGTTDFYNCGQVVSAHVTYPGGATVTQGNVEAFVYLNGPAAYDEENLAVLTYNSESQSFKGTIEVPSIGPSPYLPAIGNYTVSVMAYDPLGNFGEGSGIYYVSPLAHAPILITSKADFNSTSGVVFGDGSANNPFIIEGWQTSKINITESVNSTYIVVDNLVSGSVGDGIILSTWNVSSSNMPNAWYNFEIGNGLNGLHVYDFPNAWVGFNLAADNRGDGVKVESSPGTGVTDGSQSAGNGASGIEFLHSPDSYSGPSVEGSTLGSMTYGNQLDGILLLSSPGSGLIYNTASFNKVGINDTGSDVFAEYNVEAGNSVGEFVNGLWQTQVEDASPAHPQDGSILTSIWEDEYATGNGIGMLALNNSVVNSYGNYYIGNGQGVVSNNSTLMMDWGVEAFNINAGVTMNGMPTDGVSAGSGDCGPDPEGYSSVVGCNLAYMNGFGEGDPAPNIAVSNMAGVLLYWNEGISSAGSDTQLVNVEDSAVVYTEVTGSGGNGFDAQNVADTWFVVYSGDSTWCQVVCNLYLPGANGYGLSMVGGGDNGITDSFFYENAAGGLSFSGTSWNQVTEDESGTVDIEDNGGPGISVSGSSYFWTDNADIEDNGGNGVQISSSNFTTITDSYVYSNANESSPLTFGINVDPGSINTTITYNDIEYHWAGVGFVNADNNTATNNYICNNYVGIYVDNSVNGTYAPNTFCDNTYDVWYAPPVDGSYTIVSTGKELLGTTDAFYAKIANNLIYKPSAIVWFEVDNSLNQEVMVAGVSPDIGPLQTGFVYLALGTLPPGTYNIRAFAVTDSGVPLSNVVITATPVP